MCKKTDNIQETRRYLEKMFSERKEITPLVDKYYNLLPLTIRESYKLFKTHILNKEVCLLFGINDNEYTPVQLRKQKQLVARVTEMPVIFVFKQLHSYNIQRIIAQRVNFIVIDKQMYLHDFLINLSKPKNDTETADSVISPIAQCALLYHIEKCSLQDKTIEDIAQIFTCSYPTAARAVRWLADNNLIDLSNEKTKRLIFSLDNKSLWEKSVDLLRSPIERIVYTDETIENACISGINALSVYSMLNDESRRYYAMYKTRFRELKIQTDKKYGENIVQIWRYNPYILSDNGTVDKLSLYLSLRDNSDERIQIELEKMLNEIKW